MSDARTQICACWYDEWHEQVRVHSRVRVSTARHGMIKRTEKLLEIGIQTVYQLARTGTPGLVWLPFPSQTPGRPDHL